MRFNSEVPEDITACLEKWRTYSENSKAIEEE
jgi:23S rRNA pseudouridine1911/1915/1917 synthase